MRRLCFALLIASLTLPLFAENKPPWEWTIDERLADRFDPAKIRERDDVYVAAHPQIGSTPGRPQGKDELRYRIDGRRNPELFLPHELFESLLRNGFNERTASRENSRAGMAAPLTRAGFDPEQFWPSLESVSAAYLPLLYGNSSKAAEQCRTRFEALSAARNLFGAERFDRVLYTIVAPDIQFGAGTTFRDPARRLRDEATGCHDWPH